MAFPNYYVGSTLDTLGQSMVADRATDARLEAARMEQQRLQFAALQQALMQQAQQRQQAQQFQQELGLRQSAQDQDNAYRTAMLGLQERQFTGLTPAQDAENRYKYAALENQLKVAQATQDPRLQVEIERRSSMEAMDKALALENWEAETAASKAKAADYNASAQEIERQAAEIERKKGWGPDDPASRKVEADALRSQKYAELVANLRADQRPGIISPDATGRKFVEVLRPKPVSRLGSPVQPPQIGPVQNEAPLRDVPVKVRNSRGQVFDIMSSQWPLAKQRDPGAVLLTENPQRVVPGSVPAQHGASGSWTPASQPQRSGLLNALYKNAMDFYGGQYNNVIDYAGERLQPVVSPAMDSYQQLIDVLNSP